jgi:DNA-binding XRE family transcriptional regulator
VSFQDICAGHGGSGRHHTRTFFLCTYLLGTSLLWTLLLAPYVLGGTMAVPPVSDAAGELGRRLAQQRERLGWTQEQAAQACGVHWTMYGQAERGRRNLALHNILRLAAGLKIDPGDLVRGLRPPDD